MVFWIKFLGLFGNIEVVGVGDIFFGYIFEVVVGGF